MSGPSAALPTWALGGLVTVVPSPGEPLTAHSSTHRAASRSQAFLRMDRLCALALCTADRLIDEQGTPGTLPKDTAVVFASQLGCHKTDEAFYQSALSGQASPRLFAYTLPSSPVGEVSIHHGLSGPAMAFVGTDCAALQALAQAQSLLAQDQAPACLVLAAEVADPVLPTRPSQSALADSAGGLLLRRADAASDRGAALGAVCTAFAPTQPAAIARVLTQLLWEPQAPGQPTQVLCNGSSVPHLPAGLHALPCPLGARTAGAAQVFFLLQQAVCAKTPTLVLVSDEDGQAAGVLVSPTAIS